MADRKEMPPLNENHHAATCSVCGGSLPGSGGIALQSACLVCQSRKTMTKRLETKTVEEDDPPKPKKKAKKAPPKGKDDDGDGDDDDKDPDGDEDDMDSEEEAAGIKLRPTQCAQDVR